MNAFGYKPVAVLLTALVLCGQVFALLPGVCECSAADHQASSCCSTESSAADDCCCGSQCGVERTECGCGCDQTGSEEEPAPVTEYRVSDRLAAADVASTVERVEIPQMPQRSPANQTFLLVPVASTQVLFCVWQT